MLTSAMLEAEWLLRRLTGRGLRSRPIEPADADPAAPADIVTSVIWLPPGIATRLHELAAEFAAVQPGQHAYPAESIHATVVGPAGRPDQSPASILDDLRGVAPMIAGTWLRVAGLHLGSATVYARLEASGGDLVGARHVLRERWASTDSTGVERLLRDRLLWTTIVRCTLPPSPAFVAAVARRRRISSERFPITAIELARTNRVMAANRTVSLGRVPVAGSTPAA
jgi:hypothetical protein